MNAQVNISIAALREGAFDAAYLFQSDQFQAAVPLADYIEVNVACSGNVDAIVVDDVKLLSSETAEVTTIYGLDAAETDKFVRQDGRWRWPTYRSVLGDYARGADFIIAKLKQADACTPAGGDGRAWACPPQRPVKGNTSFTTGERIYHLPGSWLYPVTSPEECFSDVASAQDAGYRPSRA